MVIKLADFVGDDSLHIELCQNLKVPSNINSVDDLMQVSMKGVMKKDGLGYGLTADVKTNVQLLCDKCLEPVTVDIDFLLDEEFIKDNGTADDEIWPIVGNTVDLTDTVIASFTQHLPMKVLCKSDCAGLCHTCGKNLNYGDCDCDKSVIDPRFEVLRSLFKGEEV